MSPGKMIRPLAYLTALVMIAASVLLFWPDDGKADEKYQVTAYFEKAIGLFKNSDVNILGVPVGKVTEVNPQGNRVEVRMELSKEYKVPADATAQVVPISVISDRFIELAPAYTGGPVLPDGAVLDLDRTMIPAELDDVFKQLKKLLDAIQPGGPGEPGALGELIVELDRTIGGQEENLQGALTEGAQVTRTLAGTKEDLQGVLRNLNDLFGKLATRSGEFDTLNENLIVVLTAINASREDLEGLLTNVADLSDEVADLARDNDTVLEDDLRRAAEILRVVIKNEGSVRQSLSWLPILGWGLSNAYHPGDVDAVDVRDNLNAKVECEILEQIPEQIPDAIKDILEQICAEETGEPPAPSGRSEDVALPTLPEELPQLDCRGAVKQVKRQLRRIGGLGLPADVKQELLDPLGRKLRRLSRECDDLIEKVEDPKRLIDEILENVPDVGDLPDLRNTWGGLTGSAAGDSVVPVPEVEEEESGGWLGDFLGFVGLR